MNGGQLLDIIRRVHSVIIESDGADEHGELLGELNILADDVATCVMTSTEVIFSDANPLPSEQEHP